MRLAAEGLVLDYGRREAVRGVDLVIEQGDFVALVGPNGSGKSTLLRGLARLHRPRGGRVMLGESDIRTLGSRTVARELAILPQSPTAAGDLTVRELTWRGRYPHQGVVLQRSSPADLEAVEWALTAADVDGLADRHLGELSGGERQRAWIAMALAQRPRVLLLDEPTSFLDVQHQLEVLELLRRLNAEGLTVVVVLHDLVLGARFARRIVAMREGSIALDGEPLEVLNADNLKAVFGVQMVVLSDPDTGLPVPIARSRPF